MTSRVRIVNEYLFGDHCVTTRHASDLDHIAARRLCFPQQKLCFLGHLTRDAIAHICSWQDLEALDASHAECMCRAGVQDPKVNPLCNIFCIGHLSMSIFVHLCSVLALLI
jgi:hypothetical protein